MTCKLQRRWLFKALVSLCAVTAMLTVAAASSSAAHIHAKAPAGQCEICFTLHVVSSEAVAIVQLVQAPEAHESDVPSQTIAGYPLPALRPAVDRGPPSL